MPLGMCHNPAMATLRGSQLPSLRLHLRDRLLIEEAARASGQSVTEWARRTLIESATAIVHPKPVPPAIPLRVVPSVKRRGLELDEETSMLLAGGRPPGVY